MINFMMQNFYCCSIKTKFLKIMQEKMEDMWAKKLGIEQGIAGKKIIIQGFGNVGYWAAKFFTEAGAIIVGVAQQDGSIYNVTNGIDPESLWWYKKGKSGINGFVSPQAEYFHND